MTRPSTPAKTPLSILLLVIPCCTTLAASITHAAQDHPPNIVFVLTDDQRWDAIGCAGNDIIQTPNLDRLADEGTRFANCFCTTSICSVSRASFITGQYASRHGIRDFGTPLAPRQLARTFPLLLRKAGYHTGFVGKWGLGGPLPEKHFDDWAGYSGQGRYFEPDREKHLTMLMADQAERFLDRRPDDKPFLLCISTKAPHAQDRAPQQFQPAHRYRDLYADVTIPKPPTATEEAFQQLPDFIRVSEGRIRWERRFANPEMFQNSVKDYYRLITGVDHLVGRVMKNIAAAGDDGRTVFIFTADNGFFLGEHGMAGKWLMYEESIRLPMIIRDPRLPDAARGRTSTEMVLNIDVAPTILTLAGLDVPPEMQGRNMVPLLTPKPDADWRDSFFYEHHYGHRGRIPRTEGVRTNTHKYVRYIDHDPPYEQLFDLVADPHELDNLAEDPQHAGLLQTMRDEWKKLARQAAAGPTPPAPESPGQRSGS